MASQRPLTVAARNDVSLTVLPLTSDLYDMPSIRVTVEPGEGTGLRLRSQVMVDKVATILRAKAGTRIGRLGLPHSWRSDDGRQQTIRTPHFSLPDGELDTEKRRPRQAIGALN